MTSLLAGLGLLEETGGDEEAVGSRETIREVQGAAASDSLAAEESVHVQVREPGAGIRQLSSGDGDGEGEDDNYHDTSYWRDVLEIRGPSPSFSSSPFPPSSPSHPMARPTNPIAAHNMSVSHSLVWKRPVAQPAPDDGEFRRKKLKLNDLPVTSAKRTVIDGLLLTFKKSGEFDKLRKGIFSQFDSSEAKAKMLNSIEELTDREVDRQAKMLLSRDRRQAAALIEGAVERSNTYKLVDSKIEELVQSIILEAEDSLRKARENEIGADAALEELKRGGKTDDEYLTEYVIRKQARMRVIEEENAAIRKKEEEAKQKREEEKRRKEEEEAAKEREKEKEREREREEREERRRKEREEREKEREKERERDRERERELEKEREERRERRRREDEERRARRDASRDRSRTRDRSRGERRRRSRSGDRSRRRSPDIYRGRRYSEDDDRGNKVLNASEKDLEAIALQELLKEGQKAASSTAPTKAAEPEDALEPPPRKMLAPKSIVPRDPLAARLAKLDSPKPSTPVKSEDRSRAGSIIPSIEKDRESEAGERKRTPSRSRERRSSRYSRSPDDRRRSKRFEDDDRTTYRPPRRSRSRSRESYIPISRRDASRSRSRDRRRRERTRSRSRSPVRRRRDRSDSRPRRRERSPSKDAPEIDRYVPSTSRRSPIPSSRRDRDRSRDREEPRRRAREDSTPPPPPSARRRVSRSRTRSRERRREEREDSRDPGGRSTRHRYAPDEIDRYVPGTSQRADLREFKARDRDTSTARAESRTREKTPEKKEKEKEKEKTRERSPAPARKRERSRDTRRERSRDRRESYDRRDRSRDRDRNRRGDDLYTGSSGRRDRSRQRSRSRSRNRDRVQNRDRERDRGEDRYRGSRRRSRSASATAEEKPAKKERKDGTATAAPKGSKMYAAGAQAPASTAKPAGGLHFTSLTWKKTS